MADRKISELTTLSPVDNADFIAVVDVSAGETKKATRADFKGDPGADGANGDDGISFIWKDGYSGATAYVPNDVVSYNGSSYVCILNSTGNLPTNGTYFQLMAQKGADGAGAGDMLAATYDPQTKEEDVFAYSDRQFVDIKRLGFINQTETTIAFDGVNTFTLGDAGAGWSYYRAGIKYTIGGDKTVVLPGTPVTTGKYFISIDATDGTLSQSTTPWTLDDNKLPVATVAFNDALTPKYQMADERHSIRFDSREHKYHHETSGTQYISGGEPTGYTLATDTDVAKVFGIAATIIADEDLYQTLPILNDPDGATNAYVLAYLSGGNWVWADSIMPFKYTGAGYMEYDNGGTMTAGTNGDYINSYIFYSNIQGAGRYLIFSGKAAFATAAQAYAESFASFSMVGMFTGEGVALYQLTWQLASANTSKGKNTLNRVQRITSNILTSTAVSATTHNGLSGLELAGAGVTYGHIDASTQTIAGDKTFSGAISASNLSGTNTGDVVKASGAEMDTGTDDAKFATAKAINDSHNVPSVAPSTSGNIMQSNGTDWVSTNTLTAPLVLGENTAIALDPAGSTDGKYSGITVTGVSGYTQAFGDLVYLDPTDSRWEAVDANAASGADGDGRGVLGIVVVAGTDGNACTIILHGIIRADAKFDTFTINNPVYASETAGAVTQTQPTTTDVVIRIVGSALTANELYFNPDRVWITHT